MTTVIETPKEILPPKLAGKAIYLELILNPECSPEEQRRGSWEYKYNPTRQVIIFPSWVDNSGARHSARMVSRDVSSNRPRAQWDWSAPVRPISAKSPEDINSYYAKAYAEYEVIEKSDQKLMAQEDLKKALSLAGEIALRRLSMGSAYKSPINPETGEPDPEAERYQYSYPAWVIRENKPIAVEVTDEDLGMVLSSTTPQAVIRRINKVRASLDNFPEKLG